MLAVAVPGYGWVALARGGEIPQAAPRWLPRVQIREILGTRKDRENPYSSKLFGEYVQRKFKHL